MGIREHDNPHPPILPGARSRTQLLDYLRLTRGGRRAELDLLREVGGGVFELAAFGRRDVDRAADVAERHADLGMGLADASIVVLAARYQTTRLLTLDERHFRAIRCTARRSPSCLPTPDGPRCA